MPTGLAISGGRNVRGRRFSPRLTSAGIQISLTDCPKGMGAAVRRIVTATLSSHRVFGGDISIAFVTKPEMKRLHAQWLDDPSCTDVLTFNMSSGGKLEGQIIVCTAVAREEGRRLRVPWREELLRYVVHGCLHLCGYDDRAPRQAARMWREQERLLKKVVDGG